MKKIKTVIVDDESGGREALEKVLNGFSSSFEIIGVAKSSEEGLERILTLKPDLVFSDIEMPVKSGLEMIREAQKSYRFNVVLTTAHEQYAIKAINQFDVIGYLLKPIDLDEFYAVERKILERFSNPQEQQLIPSGIPVTGFPQKIFLPKAGGKEAVDPADIYYCKASGPYTEIYLKSGEMKTVSKPLKSTEAILTTHLGFFRVHDSYLINSLYISEIRNEGEAGVVVLNKNIEVDISRRKKADFITFLETRGLFFR